METSATQSDQRRSFLDVVSDSTARAISIISTAIPRVEGANMVVGIEEDECMKGIQI